MSETIKVRGIRKIIATRMSESWNVSPKVDYIGSVDMTNFNLFRKEKSLEIGVKLSANVIFAKACSKALTEFPYVNASFKGETIELHSDVNVGFAVSAQGGVLVPNVKNCHQKDFKEVAKELDRLFEGAREGTIGMEDMTGGTFTITNMGITKSVEIHTPIINQPEVAILGVYFPIEKPVVIDGKIEIRPIMNICLSADHRIIDGEMAGRFHGRIKELLENPEKI